MRKLVLLLALLPGLAAAADRLRHCAPGELEGPKPKDAEVEAHRLMPLPMPVYRADTKMGDWGMYLTLAIDTEGKPLCFVANSGGDEPYTVASTPQREVLFDALASWRYRPFERDGKAVSAVVEERIDEAMAQDEVEALPKVADENVWMAFDRSTCLGTCPAYRVEIRGNGQAVFVGQSNVDVRGRHEFKLPREQARALVRQLRSTQLWSLRTDRGSIFPDAQFNELQIMAGTKGRKIVHGAGFGPQLPDFHAFTREMEKVANVDRWTSVTPETVQQLQREGFRFDSVDGRQLLLRAVANDSTRNEDGLLALLAAGVPLDPAITDEDGESLLDLALLNSHLQVSSQLVVRGALETDGKPDQAKIDKAFNMAIRSANLAEVELVWNAAGPQARPSMRFEDVPLGEMRHPARSQQTPVIMLIAVPWGGIDERWQGLEVAKWLLAHGVDPKAVDIDGRTVLDIAASSGDGEFIRWALAQGLAPGKDFDLGDYDVDEDAQIALLEAGFASKLDKKNREELFSEFERYNRQRAMAWLVRHPPQ